MRCAFVIAIKISITFDAVCKARMILNQRNKAGRMQHLLDMRHLNQIFLEHEQDFQKVTVQSRIPILYRLIVLHDTIIGRVYML